MKKSWIMSGVAVAMGMLVGCQTASQVNKEYEEYSQARTKVETVVSGDKAIDAVAVLSAKGAEQTNKLLTDYVSATNKEYRHCMALVESKTKNNDKKMSEADAFADVKNEYMKTEEGKKEWANVEIGRKSVDSLNPANKLKEIGVLLLSEKDNAQKASTLKDSFKGFDASSLEKARAVKKIIDQTEDSLKALNFLQRFYSMNQAIPRS